MDGWMDGSLDQAISSQTQIQIWEDGRPVSAKRDAKVTCPTMYYTSLLMPFSTRRDGKATWLTM